MKSILISLVAILFQLMPSAAVGSLAIQNPGVQSVRFNPSNGESAKIDYSLTVTARVSIRVYNADDVKVRTVVDRELRSAGKHTEVWNGYDDLKAIVPDEVYYFVIEAVDSEGATCVYDPVLETGGEELEIDVDYDAKSHQMKFNLQKSSRIVVRAGLAGGPLIRTPVDWLPFHKGVQHFEWDGRDESGVINVGASDQLKFYAIGYALAECSVITFGNEALTHPSYLAALPSSADRKTSTAHVGRKIAISPFWGRSLRDHRAIRFSLSEPEIANGRLTATIKVFPDDLVLLRGVPYEVIAFIGSELLLDDEQGHSPYKLSLNLTAIPPGEHLLSVNVASVTDRIGVQNVLFTIPKKPK